MSTETMRRMKEELADKEQVLLLFHSIKDSETYRRLEKLYAALENMIEDEENGSCKRFKKI